MKVFTLHYLGTSNTKATSFTNKSNYRTMTVLTAICHKVIYRICTATTVLTSTPDSSEGQPRPFAVLSLRRKPFSTNSTESSVSSKAGPAVCLDRFCDVT